MLTLSVLAGKLVAYGKRYYCFLSMYSLSESAARCNTSKFSLPRVFVVACLNRRADLWCVDGYERRRGEPVGMALSAAVHQSFRFKLVNKTSIFSHLRNSLNSNLHLLTCVCGLDIILQVLVT